MADQETERRELTIRRVLGAPREVVFRAWTECELLAQWWGPRGFTAPVCEVDPRPGGALRFDMRGPDGAVYPMKGVFQEVVAPERIVATTTAFEDEAGNPQLEVYNTVTFVERDGGTELDLHAVVVKAEGHRVEEALRGMEQGWSESLYKLAEVVEKV
jgi:uncharacterized protein YndB with AHSA1/START domain